MVKIIGKVTTYTGNEYGYLAGCKVKIVSILHDSEKPGAEEYENIKNDKDLEKVGGVTKFDRIEVQPWIEKEGRFSFVTSDPKAVDLECFRYLTK